jgi:hypothetical protein
MSNHARYGFAVGLAFTFLLACLVSIPTRGVAHEAQANASVTSSLCVQGEKTVFSCALKNSKTISLCSSAKLNKDEGYLQYRFGVPGKIELEYPKERAAPQKAFQYNHYFRAQVDLTEISFSIDSNVYSVFDNFNGEEKPAISEEGVSVTPGDKKKAVTYVCRGRAKVDFTDISETLPNESSPEQ